MSDYLDATEAWPRHGTLEWNDTLEYARERGWFYKVHSAHGGGEIVCRIGVQRSDACLIPVYSTGADSAGAAMLTRRKIKKCPHIERVPGPESARQIMISVNSYLDIGEDLLDARDALTSVEFDFLQLDEALDQADQLIRLAEQDEDAREAQVNTQARALELGLELGDPPDPGVALGAAGAHIESAHDVVRGASGALVRAVREDVNVARARLTYLRARMTSR